MMVDETTPDRGTPDRFATAAAYFAIIIGSLVLIGWTLGVEWLKRVAPGLVAMNPMTAVLFMLLGTALLWSEQGRPAPRRRQAKWMAALVVALGGIKLWGTIAGWSSGIDTWLFAGQLSSDATSLPNRMAPNTAFDFVLLGLAILFIDQSLGRGHRPSEYLAAAAALVALIALLGYAYKIGPMSGLPRFIPMALHTALAFLLAALGVLALRSKSGWMALVTGSGPGGTMSRLMLPGLVLLMTVIGWLRVRGEEMALFDSDLGVTLYTVTVIVLGALLTLRAALSLDQSHARQRHVELEREQAFAELKQSEGRIRSIVDTAYDAFVSINATGHVLEWNSAAERMFGWSRQECVGKRLSELIIPHRYRTAHEQGLARRPGPGNSQGKVLNRHIEMSALDREGVEFPVQMTIWPLGDGVARTYNAFIGDITERKEAEKRIQKLHADLLANANQLEQSNAELEAFSYTVSHDLRAPLRHIDGYARMLHEDAADQLQGDTRRYLDEISAAARRMGALIDDLLAFSRLSRKPLQRTEVDMRKLIEGVLGETSEADEATVVIDGLPMVHADPVLLRQVWVNLLSNAIKYSAPRGKDARIEISGVRDGALVRYRIRDNGVGFDMRYVDKLFGVFQRLHSDEDFHGTGVGLAIVRRIVTRHGGRIAAEGEPGVGAVFTLELPVADHADGEMPTREDPG
ncbi:MAG: PAS domain S-box protein [Dokdonella sp.]|nr:PAS domain S-box protein [Dokdonella sp.]